MHLIEVAELMRNTHPGALRIHSLDVDGCLKPGNSGEKFRGKSDFGDKASLVLPQTQSTLVGEVLNVNCPVAAVRDLGSFHDQILLECVARKGQ
jgi:hypothetical protein